MKALLIGAPDAVAALVESLRAEGVEAQIAESVGDDETEIALLARELTHLETVLGESKPSAVVLADAGDRALAGALVAVKLLIPVAVVADSQGRNHDLLAHLADRIVPADGGEIAAWIASPPTLSRP